MIRFDRRRLRTDGGSTGLLVAMAAGVPLAATWIALTALTGSTYHLAPVLIAAAPGLAARKLSVSNVVWTTGVLAAAAGAVTGRRLGPDRGVDIVPSATLIASQPGGVTGEVLAGGALGTLVAARLAAAVRPGPPPASGRHDAKIDEILHS